MTLNCSGDGPWDKTPVRSLASPGRDLGTSPGVRLPGAPSVGAVPEAQQVQGMPYLVGEAIGTHGLEVQVGLEQLQEAVVDLLQKGHVWGYLRAPLGLSQHTFWGYPSLPPHPRLIPARKSLSTGHISAHGSTSRCPQGWEQAGTVCQRVLGLAAAPGILHESHFPELPLPPQSCRVTPALGRETPTKRCLRFTWQCWNLNLTLE